MYPGTVTRVIMKFDLPQIVDKYGKPSYHESQTA